MNIQGNVVIGNWEAHLARKVFRKFGDTRIVVSFHAEGIDSLQIIDAHEEVTRRNVTKEVKALFPKLRARFPRARRSR